MINFLILNVLDVFLKENYSITSFMGSLGPLLKMDSLLAFLACVHSQ